VHSLITCGNEKSVVMIKNRHDEKNLEGKLLDTSADVLQLIEEDL